MTVGFFLAIEMYIIQSACLKLNTKQHNINIVMLNQSM